MRYPTLASSASINGLQLRNRFILAAMGSNYAETDGSCGERIQAYYEERARGGAGMLILETTSVAWPAACSMPNMVGFSEERFIPGLSAMVKRVHKHGCKMAAQLNHSGKVSQEDVAKGIPLLIPSELNKARSDMMGYLTPQELGNFIKMAGPDGKGARYQVMDQTAIDNVVDQFRKAAEIALQAGFDAIEIHGGHGYLINSFLSPAVNKREDHYGGTIENRARLMCEIIAAVRQVVGPGFPLMIRLDAKEYRVEGGITPDDFIAVAKLAKAAGIDAIDVSAYGSSYKAIAFTEAPLVHQPGGFLEFAKRARREVDIPIIAVGRVELDVAEQDISSGAYDFLAMGRKLLADPELPAKVASDNIEAIRPCIYCYICVSQIFINQPLICAVNSRLGQEYQPDIIASTGKQQHIVVVGGGPGGMEAARLLAEQGNQVTLLEQSGKLGGTANIAALAYEPNGRLIDYLSQQLKNLRVDVRLNTRADNALLKQLGPDQIIIATGAKREAPDISGKHLPFVFDGEELRSLLLGGERGMHKLAWWKRFMVKAAGKLGLTHSIPLVRKLSKLWMPIGQRVAIIGSGLVGVEVAEFLTERGRQVTIIDEAQVFGPELSIVRRSRVLHLLVEHGCKLIKGAKVQGITPSGQVEYRLDDENQSLSADTVIIALGAQSDNSLAQSLSGLGVPLHSLGDCEKIGYIDGAIHGARRVVSGMNQTESAAA